MSSKHYSITQSKEDDEDYNNNKKKIKDIDDNEKESDSGSNITNRADINKNETECCIMKVIYIILFFQCN